jgi:hypothetical protein
VLPEHIPPVSVPVRLVAVILRIWVVFVKSNVPPFGCGPTIEVAQLRKGDEIVHVKLLSRATVPVPEGELKPVSLNVVWAVASQVIIAGVPDSLQSLKARIGEIFETPAAGVVKVKVAVMHLMIEVE